MYITSVEFAHRATFSFFKTTESQVCTIPRIVHIVLFHLYLRCSYSDTESILEIYIKYILYPS